MNDFKELAEEITKNPEEGEAYIALGDYYNKQMHNSNQAYLCFEYAYHRCKDAVLKEQILQKMTVCRKTEDFSVVPTAIVILSYNAKEIMQECLNAIRTTCDEGTYEVVIIDNVSTDGIREWLMEQTDIKLILNEKNSGFAAGCNQGAKIANPFYDILLLNNDAILTQRALFYMRLGLYSDKKMGIAGPVSNNVIPEQKYDTTERAKQEWFTLADTINQPVENGLQYSHWLQGYALLVKRRAWDEAGGLDTNFGFGGAEDLEYGIRMNAMGYKAGICKNSFVFHYGSTSMKKKPEVYSNALYHNHRYFEKKYNIDVGRVLESSHYCVADMIHANSDQEIRVLEINGGFSNTLNMVKYKYPKAEIYAIEKNAQIAHIASNYLNAVCCDLEKEEFPFNEDFFDYIIMVDVVEYLEDPLKTLAMLKKHLKKQGHLFIGSPNADHISVIDALVHGNFVETINRTSLKLEAKHYYTTDDLWNLITQCGYRGLSLLWSYSSEFDSLSESQWKTLEMILALPDAKDRNTYIHTGVIIDAMRD